MGWDVIWPQKGREFKQRVFFEMNVTKGILFVQSIWTRYLLSVATIEKQWAWNEHFSWFFIEFALMGDSLSENEWQEIWTKGNSSTQTRLSIWFSWGSKAEGIKQRVNSRRTSNGRKLIRYEKALLVRLVWHYFMVPFRLPFPIFPAFGFWFKLKERVSFANKGMYLKFLDPL